ncbi:MAG: ABC transporter permease [Alphaproteobacteria bacterium]
MGGFVAVFRKELRTYFATPIAYALMAVFWAMSGYFFSFNVFFVSVAHMVTSFHNMSLLLLLILPLLTMRLFAEENSAGTIELLLTLPLNEVQIVLGKFAAALVVLLLMLLGSTVAVAVLLLYAQPDLGPIIGGYAGVFLLGTAFLAIGMFVSSLSSNQIVAALVGWAVLVLLWFIDYVATFQAGYVLTRTVRHVSFSVHYLDLIRGVINTGSLAYFIGLVVAMVVCTIQALRARRT